MDVATLIAELLPLLRDPVVHSDAILALLRRGKGLADYEVARFVAARHAAGMVASMMADPDPRKRRAAVGWVELTFARSPAAQWIRIAAKDRAKSVRQAAFRAARALRLDDVALPDPTYGSTPGWPDRVGKNPFTGETMVLRGRPAIRGMKAPPYDPSGWRFGLHPSWPKTRSPSPALSQLQTRNDVEALLGVSSAQLAPLLRAGSGPGCPYVAFEVPKATGGVRVLHAPRNELKRLQRRILHDLLAELPTHDAAHGFVPGHSTVTNAAPHQRARVIVKMDLVDFFPTIHFGRLVGLFEFHGAGNEAARLLAALVTYRPLLPDGRVAWPSVLPQGAPTSPKLSNLVCRRLDARLTALATTAGARYTRYADDLTFSFAEEPSKGLGRFIWWVNQVVHQEGFIENMSKRRVLRPAGQMRVTGLVTNTGLSVPRDARRRFRAILHACARDGVSEATTGHAEPRAFLLGFAAYVAMVQPDTGKAFRVAVMRLLASA